MISSYLSNHRHLHMHSMNWLWERTRE